MSLIKSKRTSGVMEAWLLLALLIATTGEAMAERLPIKKYTTAEGLARDSVNRILQDSRGFLWFCTTEGLSRFDGYSFINYGRAQGLPGRQVNDILEGHGGVYWIATSDGLCRLKPDVANQEVGGEGSEAADKFVVYYPDNAPSKRYISALYEDAAGTLWCGTGDGVYRFDQVNGHWEFSPLNLAQTERPAKRYEVQAIADDRRGGLWINTPGALFRRRADGIIEAYTEKEGLPFPLIRQGLLCDQEGRVWVGTTAGLYQLSRDAQPGRRVVERVYTTKDGLASNFVDAVIQSSDGQIWVGTSSGLNAIQFAGNDDGRVLLSYTSANSLSDVTIRALAEDRDGNLWMGTESGGAMKLARNGFTSYVQEDGLGNTRIAAFVETRAEELCVINGNGIINRFDGNRFTAVALRLPKGMTYWGWGWYQVMLQDHTGEWWVSTGEGVMRYPKTSRVEQLSTLRPKAIYTQRDGLGSNNIFRLYEDARGDIWIGTLERPEAVLTRWDRATETLHTYSPSDTGHEDSPSAFCEDGSGNLWIGFYNGGVVRYKAGSFSPFTEADGLPAGFIRGFHVDHSGRLWIATSDGGLGRVDDPAADRPRFITYTTDDGLSSNHVTCVMEDRWGKVYIGTGRGLNRLDTVTGHIKHYTTADGLANNYINVSFADGSGALWFGTLQGLSRIVPQPESPTPPPPVLISALHIAGVEQTLPELGAAEIAWPDLATDRNQIQIEFLGLSLGVGESLRYEYKLEGAGQDWSPPADQRTVNFASLAPGAYRFLVRAVSADGTRSQSPATLTFKILPPIWRRWWFITMAVVLAGSAVFAFDRYRVARLKELDAALTQSRKLTEQLTQRGVELHHANRSLALESAITAIISESANLSEAAPKILQAVCEIAEWEAGELWELDQQHLQLRCVEVWDNQTNGNANSSHAQVASASAPRSAFGFPILLGQEVLGVLKLFTRTKREQDAEVLEMMTSIGSHIGQLIDRKRSEEALRKSREERLAELERVRRRIATDLHDDIGSSLTQITILSEVAHRHAKPDDKEILEPLAQIINVSNELVDAMSDIVWAINPKKDHLSDLLQRMRRFASDIFTARNIAFRFLAPTGANDLELGANLRRELFLVFKESVNNTVKHSGCSRAEIEFQVDGDWLTLKVSDDGKGFDAALAVDSSSEHATRWRGGNGITSMRKRAVEMGGEFNIVSGKGEGTTSTFRVPVSR